MIQTPSGFGLKRLLVATDFSPRAEIALRRAVQIVSEHGAALSLLHVCDADARDERVSRQQPTPSVEEALRQKIDKLFLPDKAAGTVRIATGKPFVELSAALEMKARDLWSLARMANIF